MANSSASKNTQLWLVTGLAVVITSALIGAYFLLAKPPMAVLLKDLRPADAAAVVSELEAAGATYELRDGGTTILAPANDVDQLRLKIASADLPIRGLDGFELFDDSDLGLTDFAQRIKYQRAIQGELARTIMKIEGVAEARVHISMPERSVFRGERVPAKAAVTLSMRERSNEGEAVEGVQQLVAAAIPDLSPSEVVVLNARGQVISPKVTAAAPALAPPASPELAPILAALKAALPGHFVQVDVVDTSPAPDAAGPAPQKAIQVTTSVILNADEQQRAAQTVEANRRPEHGSAVLFVVVPLAGAIAAVLPEPAPIVTRPVVAPAEQRSAVAPFAEEQPNTLILIVAGIAALLFAALLFVLVRRRDGLSLDDQRKFAERLKLSLQSPMEEPNDVRS